MQKGLVFANWKVDRTLLGVFQGPNKSVKTNTYTSALESRASSLAIEEKIMMAP